MLHNYLYLKVRIPVGIFCYGICDLVEIINCIKIYVYL